MTTPTGPDQPDSTRPHVDPVDVPGEIHDLTGAYALDALDEHERVDFEDHLTRCERCRQEVADLSMVLPEVAPTKSTSPPPHLRARVLDLVAHTPQEQSASTEVETSPADRPVDASPRAADEGGTDEAMSPGTAQVVPLRRRRAVAALAAAAALVVGGGLAWETTRPESSQGQEMAQQVLQAPDARRRQVSARDGGTVTLVTSARLGRAAVVTEGLPAAGDGRAYQAWMQDDTGAMHPAGMLPSRPGATVLTGDLSQATGVGLTLEPEGGSPEPTSAPVAILAL